MYEMLYCDHMDCRVNTFEAGDCGDCPACQFPGEQIPVRYEG